MEFSDLVSVGAATISLVALVVSFINRKDDIAREEEYRIRNRVWEVLNGEAGLRTVSALEKGDGKTDTRIELLKRTALQLKFAGAKSLGESLDLVVKEQWPNGNEASIKAREDFQISATMFMNPELG